MSVRQQSVIGVVGRLTESERDVPVLKKIAFLGLCVVAAASVCANILLFYRWSDRRPVVTFDNNQAISKIEYEDALDNKDQGAVLKRLLFRAIVEDAAAKAGVSATPQEVDQRLAEVQRASPQLLQGDGTNPGDDAENRADMTAAVDLDNLRFQNVSCTEEDVRAYYTEHEDQFLLPKQSLAVLVVAKDPVDSATAERLLRTGARPDAIAQTPGLLVSGLNGFTLNMQALPQATAQEIEQAVYSMPVGAVKTFTLGQYFLSVRLQGRDDARIPGLSEVHDEIVRDVKNQKALTIPEELAKIYQSAHVQFGVEKYASYFDDVRTFDTNDASSAQAGAPSQ
jgi:hypothetical protein